MEEWLQFYKLIDSVAESSVALEVAKMAGLPEEVIKSSKKILQVLEGRSLENNTLQKKKIYIIRILIQILNT